LRLVWLVALGVLAVVMAVLTPYVFHTQSTSQAIGWCLMLVCTVAAVAVLVRAEFLFRALDRIPARPGPERDDRQA
jgi:drug/metabolite transporter (DMT)-like permease